jgi:hypothetical protein
LRLNRPSLCPLPPSLWCVSTALSPLIRRITRAVSLCAKHHAFSSYSSPPLRCCGVVIVAVVVLSSLRCRRRRRCPSCGVAGLVIAFPAVLQASSSFRVSVMHVPHARIRYHHCLPAVLQASSSLSFLRCCRRRRLCLPCGAAGVVVVKHCVSPALGIWYKRSIVIVRSVLRRLRIDMFF